MTLAARVVSGLAIGFGVLITGEATLLGTQGNRMPEPSPSIASPSSPPSPPLAERSAEQAATAIERPLFSPSRRPAAPPAAAATPASPSLPRLAGTVIGPLGRHALFAGTGKPVTVGVNDQVGGWIIQAIEAANVTLAGPDGVHQLRVAFDPAGPAKFNAAVFAAEAGLLWDNPCGRVHRRANGKPNRSIAERCSTLTTAIPPEDPFATVVSPVAIPD